MGFTYRKYQVNEDYFKTWTSEMSYVLGLIFADGNVRESSKKKGPALRISSIDIDLLETVRSLMGSTHIIRTESNKNGTWLTLAIYSIKIVHDLISIGIKPRKSLTCTMLDVPEKYQADFIRGLFDGDGSVCEIKRHDANTPGIEVDFATGSPIFRQQLSSFLNNKLATQHGRFIERTNNNGVGIVRGSNKCSEALYGYMYNGGPCLRRKYDKYTSLISRRQLIVYNYK